MKRVLLEPAYVLHRRAYRESSCLVELFSKEHGRFTVVAKGMRKSRSSTQGLLQPFIPLLVSWSGKGELMTLIQVEANGAMVQLQDTCLFAGLYLNELLMLLLQKWDAHAKLYTAYETALAALQTQQLEEKTLRAFEKTLLEELGYGLLSKADEHTFLAERCYRFVPEYGFQLTELNNVPTASSMLFLGKNLIAIAKENWQDEQCLQDAKRLTRLILTPLLGGRPLHSRRLFMNVEKNSNNEA